jgi:hypothetical protein
MRILAGLLILIVAACDSPSEPDSRWAIPENITYAPSLEIDLAAMNMTESGLYWQDIEIRTEGSPSCSMT